MYLLKTFFGRNRKSLAQLKLEISVITSSIIRDIESLRVSQEYVEILSELMLDQDKQSSKAFKDWSENVGNALVPVSSQLTESFLFDRRWDIAFLSKEEHCSLRDYLSYSGELCTTVIDSKITEAVERAESIAKQESMLLAMMEDYSDDTVH